MKLAVTTCKYEQVVLLNYGKPAIEVHHKEVIPVALTFQRNVRRNAALGELPITTAGWSSVIQNAETLAMVTAANGVPFDEEEYTPGSPKFKPELAKKRQDAFAEAWQAVRDVKPTSEDIKAKGSLMMYYLLESNASSIPAGIDAVFSGMILGAWTAFEALAHDLWEIAINHGPKEWPANC